MDNVQYICTYPQEKTPAFWNEPENDFWHGASENAPAENAERKCKCFVRHEFKNKFRQNLKLAIGGI